MKNISHDVLSQQIRAQTKPMMEAIYERIKAAFETYDFTTTLSVSARYELTEGGFVFQILGSSPTPDGQQGNEYIYAVLENEFTRFYFGGLVENKTEKASLTMETLPRIFDLISAYKAIEELYTTTIPNGWTFPLSATVINKI